MMMMTIVLPKPSSMALVGVDGSIVEQVQHAVAVVVARGQIVYCGGSCCCSCYRRHREEQGFLGSICCHG